MELEFGSICSGIEAASVAWAPMGWKASWLAEVDVAASQVLAHRLGATQPKYPLAGTQKAIAKLSWRDRLTNYGDMTVLPDLVRLGVVSAPPLLCGGTPCQAFSVAGRREGMKDPRGGLTLSFVDLADAIDERRADDGDEPCIVYWENVPGVLSDEHNAFGCFLAALVGDDAPVEPGPRPEPARSSAFWTWDKKTCVHRAKWPDAGVVAGPTRTVAWRIGDAQYFGLAQRRRRVVLVGSAREGFDPAAILLEFEGVRRDSPPSRETGEGPTHAVAPCLTGSGRGVERTGDPRGQDPVVACFKPGPGGPAVVGPTWWDGSPISQTLDAVLYKGQTMPEKNRFPAVLQPIAHVEIMPTMTCGGDPDASHNQVSGHMRDSYLVPMSTEPSAFSTSGAGYWREGIGALRGRAQDSHETLIAQAVALRGREGGATAELGDDLAMALRASSGGGDKPHVLAPIAFDPRGTDVIVHGTEELSPTLRAMGHDGSWENGGGQMAVAEPTMAVRRLMPIECHRLQGFPDDWCAVPIGNRIAADGPQYKQLGNSWAVNHARWAGWRINTWLEMQTRVGANDMADLLA